MYLWFIWQHVELQIIKDYFLRSVDRAYRYNHVKKNQLDAQLTLSLFRQPLRVSGISRLIIRRYNHMSTTVGTYYSF